MRENRGSLERPEWRKVYCIYFILSHEQTRDNVVPQEAQHSWCLSNVVLRDCDIP